VRGAYPWAGKPYTKKRMFPFNAFNGHGRAAGIEANNVAFLKIVHLSYLKSKLFNREAFWPIGGEHLIGEGE
jgi:hypothetical protein